MKIIINEKTKNLELYKNDGTLISSYSYKNAITEDFTIEDLKKENESFNKTLELQEEFDSIKDIISSIKAHNWNNF